MVAYLVPQLIYCLQLGRRSFIEYDFFRDVYESSSFIMVRLVGLIHRIVDLLPESRVHQIDGLDESSPSSSIRRLVALDEELSLWQSTLDLARVSKGSSDLLARQPVYLENLTTIPGAPESFSLYDDLQVLYVWNLYRVLRIAMHCSILRSQMVQIGECQMLPSQQESTRIILGLFEDMCQSVYANFLVHIDGRAPALDVADIIGLRQIFLLLPLLIAMGYIQTLPINPVSKERWIWIQQVVDFLQSLNHTGRNG